MFYHAYRSYMDNAYPADELMPLSCQGRYRGVTPSRGDMDDILGKYVLLLLTNPHENGNIMQVTSWDSSTRASGPVFWYFFHQIFLEKFSRVDGAGSASVIKSFMRNHHRRSTPTDVAISERSLELITTTWRFQCICQRRNCWPGQPTLGQLVSKFLIEFSILSAFRWRSSTH